MLANTNVARKEVINDDFNGFPDTLDEELIVGVDAVGSLKDVMRRAKYDDIYTGLFNCVGLVPALDDHSLLGTYAVGMKCLPVTLEAREPEKLHIPSGYRLATPYELIAYGLTVPVMESRIECWSHRIQFHDSTYALKVVRTEDGKRSLAVSWFRFPVPQDCFVLLAKTLHGL